MTRTTALLLCLLLFFSSAALGEEAPLGQFARQHEAQARLTGREVFTETSLSWGNLPLLDEATNKALASLLRALRIETRSHGTQSAGYFAADVILRDVSVLDMAMEIRNGLHYEQSNLLGGNTAVFSQDELAAFTRLLPGLSDSALPLNLDWLYGLAAVDLQGALPANEVLRPKVYLPGLYGARADVRQIPLEGAAAPMEYREVYGLSGTIVCLQAEIALAGGAALLAEWLPDGTGTGGLFLFYQDDKNTLTLLHTADHAISKASGARSRAVTEITLQAADFAATALVTHVQDATRTADKETITFRTDITLESAELLGADMALTLSAAGTDTASGEGDRYTRKCHTVWTVKGLVFGAQPVLTVDSKMKLRTAASPIVQAGAMVYPARLSEPELNQWTKDLQGHLTQAWYTCLGRVPPDVATYLLERYGH